MEGPDEKEFSVSIEREERYRFRIRFSGGADDLVMDEPKPLGSGEYPNAGKLLAAAIGNCLCASLVFCMERSRGEVVDVRADVATLVKRNDEGRWRLERVNVTIHPTVKDDLKFRRCLELFENYCIVTQSVREGIDVSVEVVPEPPA